MRLGVILSHTHLYGGVRRFIELGRVFNEAGHTFTLYTPDGLPPTWTVNNVRVTTFAALKDEYNDMLFVTDRKYKDLLARVKAGYKIFYHVSLHHKARIMVRDKRFHIFACSTNVLRYDSRWFGVTPFLAAGGINMQLFYPRENRGQLNGHAVTILIYGRIHERVKGTRIAVRACELVQKKYPYIRLLLFDTPVNESMTKAIEDFSTRVPFDFITNHPVEENAALFHQADIFVAAERGAGWSNTVAEAMACGIPVVATPSGTADLLVDGETGIAVKRNAKSIADGILRLIRSPELMEKVSAGGHRHIALFTWQKLASRIIGWYEEMEKCGGKSNE